MAKLFLCRPKTRSEIKRIGADYIRVVEEGVLDFLSMPFKHCLKYPVLVPERCLWAGNNSEMNGKQKQQQKILSGSRD